MGAFIDASPSPYHAVATAAERLGAAGFGEVGAAEDWNEAGPASFVRRGGSLVAWRLGADPAAGMRIVGAHTDSPNLRIKPQPDTGRAGVAQLGVEVYGGVLLNSWLDRDLGISGRVAIAGSEGIEERLLLIDRPVLRVPQLAIHLDREINTTGLQLNKQTHMAPLWHSGQVTDGGFRSWIADELEADEDTIRGWDLMTHDLTPSARLGADGSFFAAPRIDNLASCHAALEAMAATEAADVTLVVCLFDHEEVGSTVGHRGGRRAAPRRDRAHPLGRRRVGRDEESRHGGLVVHLGRRRARHPPQLRRAPRAGSPHPAERGGRSSSGTPTNGTPPMQSGRPSPSRPVVPPRCPTSAS